MRVPEWMLSKRTDELANWNFIWIVPLTLGGGLAIFVLANWALQGSWLAFLTLVAAGVVLFSK